MHFIKIFNELGAEMWAEVATGSDGDKHRRLMEALVEHPGHYATIECDGVAFESEVYDSKGSFMGWMCEDLKSVESFSLVHILVKG